VGEFSNLDVSISFRYIELSRNLRINTFQIALLVIGFFSLFNKFLVFCMKISYLIDKANLRMFSVMPITIILIINLKMRFNSSSKYNLS
jgi:hypothetical protein